MTTDIVAALLISVLMHVAWNLMARHQPRDAEPLWWVLLAHLVLIAPWGIYQLATSASWSSAFLALLLTSATANTMYFHALANAYRHAPVALVYPLVRSSPLLIALISCIGLGETLRPLAWLGIALNVAGLGVMASTARQNLEGRAIPWALLAMIGTSIYSLSDKAASKSIDGFSGLLGYISVGYFCAWLTISARLKRDTGTWIPRQRLHPAIMLAGGLCIGTAYALVIHAMRQLPAAEVVAFSNAGIVLAALASMLWFGECQHWRWRSLGVGLICLGLLSLAIGRSNPPHAMEHTIPQALGHETLETDAAA